MQDRNYNDPSNFLLRFGLVLLCVGNTDGTLIFFPTLDLQIKPSFFVIMIRQEKVLRLSIFPKNMGTFRAGEFFVEIFGNRIVAELGAVPLDAILGFVQ